MADQTSDKALMMQVRNGDLDALGVLFERYHRRLFAFFYRLTLQRDVSADLVQDVFERILRYRSSYTGDGDFSTWLFRIARNRHSDYHRQLAKEPPEAAESTASGADEDSIDNRLLLDQALRRLDPEKKQALILSRVEGFLYREIAEITGCTEGAVKVRIFRGLQDLRRIMDGLQRDGTNPIHPETGPLTR
jgi:RNA polymerase sigma factor (sigma-70 family)